MSLSGEDPTLHVSVSFDNPRGWYAGASLVAVKLEPGSRRAGLTTYVGFARRNAGGWGWEGGAALSRFSGPSHYDYAEAFAGILAERWNARLYFAPDYFGRGVRTLYAEFNGALPLSSTLRAFAHLGILTPLSGATPDGDRRTRCDLRTGIGWRMRDIDLQLAWVGATGGDPYAATYQRRRTVVLSAAYDF